MRAREIVSKSNYR
jgi:hypothetical protein